MPHFGINLRGGGHGIGDLGAKQCPIALAQAMDIYLERGLTETQPLGQCLVRIADTFSGQAGFKRRKQGTLVLRLKFRLEACEDGVEEAYGPMVFEGLLGGSIIHWFHSVTCFGRVELQWEERAVSAAFVGVCLIPLVGQEPLESCQKKGAEPSFSLLGARNPIALEQPREKGLRQVFSIVRTMPAAAHINIEWIPIKPAKPGQCFPGPGVSAASSG